MTEKKLIKNELISSDGTCCTLGCIALKRNYDLSDIDVYDYEKLSEIFGVSQAMIREIEYENDEGSCLMLETPEVRYVRMRNWVLENINE